MKTIKKGKVIKATENNTLYDGRPPVGFIIEIVDDTEGSTGGFYLFYNPDESGRGYDEWYETMELVENSIKIEEDRGMVIEWEE